MKNYFFLGMLLLATSLRAETGAFTYQGRLNESGAPATGIYDLQFGLWTTPSGPPQYGANQTNFAVTVSNGLFTTTLDFGLIPSDDTWLEIGVRTNGGNAFAILSPRQALTPAPKAIYSILSGLAGRAGLADSIEAANVTGTLDLAQLPAALVTNGASGVTVSGTFSGSGTGLTGLNAATLTGTVPDASLSTNAALRAGGNIFSDSQQIVGAVASGATVLDQQDPTTTLGASQYPDQWQSFTAGVSGMLTAVALEVRSPSASGNSSGTIRIYAGEGTNGALLASQSVTWMEIFPAVFQTNSFTTPAQLQAGSKYTIYFTAPVVQKTWLYFDFDNHYAGGQCSHDAGLDCLFKTFMTPGTTGQTILMANPPGFSGYVGIGTNAPQAKLHVAGDILASGTITGNGGGLTNLNAISGAGAFSGTFTGNSTGTFIGNGTGLTNLNANNLASGLVPEARFSNNVALLNRPIQAFTGGTNSFSGNVGIGTTTPASKLQVAGDIKLGTSGQYFAPAGEENLRMIRGSVSSTGTILNGSGFTATHPSGASYVITFNTSFSSNPTIVASCGAAGGTLVSQDVATIESASTTGFTVKIGVRNVGFADEPFSFIAVGPR